MFASLKANRGAIAIGALGAGAGAIWQRHKAKKAYQPLLDRLPENSPVRAQIQSNINTRTTLGAMFGMGMGLGLRSSAGGISRVMKAPQGKKWSTFGDELENIFGWLG
jgi:hypothetical protein